VFRFPVLLILPLLLTAAPRRAHKRPQGPEAPSSIVPDVSVVDVATGQILPHRDILLRGERIADVHPAASRSRRERYVIPGLWDMHVHLWNEDPQAGLYVANGVTSVRDMGGDLKRIRTLEARIARGEISGPHIYAAGAPVSATPAEPGSRMPVNLVRTPAEARHIFDLYYDQGVDVIHVRNLDARSFEALAERSRHDGIPFAGDLPDSVSAADAALDRMVSMEHLFGIGLACSSKQQELRAKVGATDIEIMDTYDPAIAASLWDVFRRYGVRQTPMLTWWNRRACLNGAGDGMAYVTESTRSTWKPAQPESDQAHYDFAMKLTHDMALAGVPILAGTDTGEPWTAPGFELHRELELLQSAGLTPAQALRAATLEPANLMRRDDQGEVKKGEVADLVVLTANPLIDIRNTRAIDEVIVRGKTMDHADIDRLLGTREHR
jgi:Amidohydrolase family